MIEILNAKILGEIFHRISQYSSRIIMQKKQDGIIISSFDNDEKSYVLVSLKRDFFEKWECSSEETIEVESKDLYNLSKIIPSNSKIELEILEEKINLTVRNSYIKDITIRGKITKAPIFDVEQLTNEFLTVKSDIFQSIVKDLNSFTNETSIMLTDEPKQIIFKAEEGQMDVKLRLLQNDTAQIVNSLRIRTPIKYLGYFSPLLREFQELQVSAIKENPLIIRGINEKWEFLLILVNIIDNKL